ncbi:hypothetical protein COCNU_09G001700 [Cocos nucifera]|uniref:Uncharacterized protein n=1 Tax=Cocos nucifera TaxID=13894 RepID=A0A8K0N6E7_COCNU|nr:hypothetical protein COCNU_09G001700 [Cocos nucifera]
MELANAVNLEKGPVGRGRGRDEASGSGLPPPSPPPGDGEVGELVASLNRRRMYREVTLALRSGLRDAMADFSFLRTRGLRNLLKFLRSVGDSDASIRLFRHSQTFPELQGMQGNINQILPTFHLFMLKKEL